MSRTKPIAVVLALFAGTAVNAQSSLGVTGATLTFGYEDGAGIGAFVSGNADVAITEFHGIQFDLALEDTSSGTLGTAGVHLYMTPDTGQKYGVFAHLGDMDGRSATYGIVGTEGLFALGNAAAVEVRAGAGVASHSSLDFLFVEADVYADLSPDLTAHAGVTLSEFDEIDLNATGYEGRVGLTYKPSGQAWGVYAELAQDDLAGLAGSQAETTVRAGIVFELGNTRRGGPETRPFRRPDPIRPLVQRGLF